MDTVQKRIFVLMYHHHKPLDHIIETGFIGQADFIFVRYSATNSGLPCNNQFPKLDSQILRYMIKCVQSVCIKLLFCKERLERMHALMYRVGVPLPKSTRPEILIWSLVLVV
jgi:hypothetical protein